MENAKDKVSYCIGFETGKNLKTQFADINISLLLEGFQDAVNESSPRLSEKEMINILGTLRQQIEVQQKQYISQLAEKNKKEGEEFLSSNKQKEDVVSLPSGLQYKVVKKGSGSNKPSVFDNVKIHYKGQFIDGHVFDSSYDRKQPQVLPVNRVIPGWSEAIQLMTIGDVWKVFIPSYLAYGEHGFAPHIPPNSVLVFDIELLEINPKQ